MSRIIEIIVIVMVILLMIIFLPLIYTQTSFLPNYSDTGQIGDTIQGIAGPFISGLSALLVYLAFKEQVKANELLLRSNNENRLKDVENSLSNNVDRIRDRSKDLTEELEILTKLLGRVNESFNNNQNGPTFIRAYNNLRYHVTEIDNTVRSIEKYRELEFARPSIADDLFGRLFITWHVLYKESLKNYFENFDHWYGKQGGHVDHLQKKGTLVAYFTHFEEKFKMYDEKATPPTT